MALPALSARVPARGAAVRASYETAASRLASTTVVLSGIVLGACLLRVFKITAVALWFDESSSLAHSRYAWSEFLTHVAVGEMHPPLYFVVLKLWCLTFGSSLF